ncbi:hypothetical protein KC348_g53 [Hortaea werneckii]|nr:hypothetical protein KC348_g53 [Hortaea werneckii]
MTASMPDWLSKAEHSLARLDPVLTMTIILKSLAASPWSKLFPADAKIVTKSSKRIRPMYYACLDEDDVTPEAPSHPI